MRKSHHSIADELQLILEVRRLLGKLLFGGALFCVFFIVRRQRTIRIATLKVILPEFYKSTNTKKYHYFSSLNNYSKKNAIHTDKPWIALIVLNGQSQKVLLKSHDRICLRLNGQRTLYLNATHTYNIIFFFELL